MTTNLLGKTLSQYELVQLIGEGGIATVYKARQPSLDRWVAVKVLHSNEEHVLARFQREAKAVALLRHRNILMVYEYGLDNGLPFIAMEYVEEGTLENYLIGEPMKWTKVVSIALSVAQALHYAHQHGLIHRDVKPSNILMPQEDWPLLADFGLVKVSDADKALTATGMIMGTPAYIAPEQARGEKIGVHADMYALGVIMFEMVTGRLPFDYENANLLLLAHIQENPPSPHKLNPNCPIDLEKIILRTLEKSPSDRYTDMEIVIAALKRLLEGSPLAIPDTGSATLEVHSKSSPDLTLRPAPLPSKNAGADQDIRLLILNQNTTIPLTTSAMGKSDLIIGRTYGKRQVDIDLGPHGAVESGISRQHSRLTKQGDNWLIEDLGSMNGTQVNNAKLTPGRPVQLKNGDVIHLGRMHLIFLTSGEL